MQIVFGQDGTIEFTRSPELLAVIDFAPKRIRRMTDIVFIEEDQRFYIVFKTGPHRNKALTNKLYTYKMFDEDYGGMPVPYEYSNHLRGEVITFTTYEDAVAAEVRYVEFLRDLGYSMR